MADLADTLAAEIRILKVDIFDVLVIQTAALVFLAGADMHAGDLVDDEQENAGHNKRPGSAGGGSRKLKTELAVVLVPPATGVGSAGNTIESDNPLVGKDTRQKIADEATDAVEGKDIETIVDRQEVLVLDDIEAAERGKSADQGSDVDGDCEPRHYVRKA